MGILSNLEPTCVFQYFEEICSIPHGSSDTKKISDYCVDFAKKHNLQYLQDSSNNVIIFKNGTSGYENSAPVMLQGHLDMVCEKEADCDIDFKTEGLRLQVSDGIISAKGTTLGGDDGIAIAYALAILASNDIPHPPLEAVFTVDEEIGMLGAAALDCSSLKSRIMLNIDSEEEGYLLVSCAGGVTATGHLPINKTSAKGIQATLKIHGLLGGHSGVEIDKGRCNACMLLGRTLYQLKKEYSFSLIQVNGGLKDNAIPREASANILLDPATDIVKLQTTLKNLQMTFQKEYRTTDTNLLLSFSFDTVSDTTQSAISTNSIITTEVMDSETSEKVITALVNLPNGIQKMSHDIDGLVQTSLNLGILTTWNHEVTFSFSVRSSIHSEKEELTDRICCLMKNLGGTTTLMGEYPAWEYRENSPLRDLMISLYEKKYGEKPVIQALHAGVECGLFAGKLPGLDCVSYGPDMKDIHTPQESMDVESVKRTWDYTLEILKNLK